MIDATNASSLELICNSNCQASKILCPTTDQSSCNISVTAGWGLQYAVAEVANSGVMRNFFLECSGSYSCQYTTVNIHNSSVIDDVSIDCSGSSTYSACRYSSFNIGPAEITNTFSLSCSSYGCYYLDVSISSSNINNIVWECLASSFCTYASMEFIADTMINTFQLDVVTLARYITLHGSAATINDLTINCADCYGAEIDAQINHSANIYCSSDESCKYASMTLVATSADSNINIECYNPSLTSSSSYGACYYANFSIYGYNSSSTRKDTNLTLQCNQRDCYYAIFNGYDIFQADVLCEAPS